MGILGQGIRSQMDEEEESRDSPPRDAQGASAHRVAAPIHVGISRVVVPESEAESYIQKGYARSDVGADEVMGSQAWGQIPDEESRTLVVMEIDDAKHEGLNKLPIRYVFHRVEECCLVGASVAQVELQSDKSDVPGMSVVARGDGSHYFRKSEVFEVRRECALYHRPEILKQIANHRATADQLEEALRRMEVP